MTLGSSSAKDMDPKNATRDSFCAIANTESPKARKNAPESEFNSGPATPHPLGVDRGLGPLSGLCKP
jgi:hypothetical protein